MTSIVDHNAVPTSLQAFLSSMNSGYTLESSIQCATTGAIPDAVRDVRTNVARRYEMRGGVETIPTFVTQSTKEAPGARSVWDQISVSTDPSYDAHNRTGGESVGMLRVVHGADAAGKRRCQETRCGGCSMLVLPGENCKCQMFEGDMGLYKHAVECMGQQSLTGYLQRAVRRSATDLRDVIGEIGGSTARTIEQGRLDALSRTVDIIVNAGVEESLRSIVPLVRQDVNASRKFRISKVHITPAIALRTAPGVAPGLVHANMTAKAVILEMYNIGHQIPMELLPTRAGVQHWIRGLMVMAQGLSTARALQIVSTIMDIQDMYESISVAGVGALRPTVLAASRWKATTFAALQRPGHNTAAMIFKELEIALNAQNHLVNDGNAVFLMGEAAGLAATYRNSEVTRYDVSGSTGPAFLQKPTTKHMQINGRDITIARHFILPNHEIIDPTLRPDIVGEHIFSMDDTPIGSQFKEHTMDRIVMDQDVGISKITLQSMIYNMCIWGANGAPRTPAVIDDRSAYGDRFFPYARPLAERVGLTAPTTLHGFYAAAIATCNGGVTLGAEDRNRDRVIREAMSRTSALTERFAGMVADYIRTNGMLPDGFEGCPEANDTYVTAVLDAVPRHIWAMNLPLGAAAAEQPALPVQRDDNAKRGIIRKLLGTPFNRDNILGLVKSGIRPPFNLMWTRPHIVVHGASISCLLPRGQTVVQAASEGQTTVILDSTRQLTTVAEESSATGIVDERNAVFAPNAVVVGVVGGKRTGYIDPDNYDSNHIVPVRPGECAISMCLPPWWRNDAIPEAINLMGDPRRGFQRELYSPDEPEACCYPGCDVVCSIFKWYQISDVRSHLRVDDTTSLLPVNLITRQGACYTCDENGRNFEFVRGRGYWPPDAFFCDTRVRYGGVFERDGTMQQVLATSDGR